MKPRTVVSLILASLLSLSLFNRVNASDVWAEPADLTESNTRFSLRMYQALARSENSNLFLSPASIHVCLGMTYAAAKGNTAAEMAHALDFKLNPQTTTAEFGELLSALNQPRLDYEKKPSYQLNMVNALWGHQNYPFNEEYKAQMNKQMGAKFESLDFSQPDAARKTINDWVEAQTNKRIVDLLAKGTVTAATRLVLTNAIYFKSAWGDEYFKAANTKAGIFHSDGKDVDAQLMHTTRLFSYYEDSDCQVVGIPYKSFDLIFYLILPRDKTTLNSLEQKLSPDKLKGWQGGASAEVILTLPKFKIESNFSLSGALKSMGMPLAFSDKANFSGMLANPADAFHIDEVINKSFVELDENGTEAAAATAVVMVGSARMRAPEKHVVNADHPFLFMIQHRETKSILFMGRVANP